VSANALIRSSKPWVYETVESPKALMRRYEEFMKEVWLYERENGLNAVVYTQLTDIENEVNGLLTYDRKVRKVDADRMRKANRSPGSHSRTEA
jgi:hypothetical protein